MSQNIQSQLTSEDRAWEIEKVRRHLETLAILANLTLVLMPIKLGGGTWEVQGRLVDAQGERYGHPATQFLIVERAPKDFQVWTTLYGNTVKEVGQADSLIAAMALPVVLEAFEEAKYSLADEERAARTYSASKASA